MAKKPKGNILTDTLETLVEPVRPIPKDVAKGVASVVDFNALIYGPSNAAGETPEKQHVITEKAVKEFGVDEKTRKENEERKKANSTPLDIQATLDKQQMEQIKKRLFDIQKKDEGETHKKADEKEQKRKQEETDEEERKKAEKEKAAQAAPEEDAHGKQKGVLGQARKKATTDSHEVQELKANKGK